MENNKLFKSFDYVVRNLFVFEDKVEVRVFFIYKEFYAMNKSLFIKKLKNKDEAYYLDEAKRIINEMINDGSLKQECEKKIKRKKLLPILIPLVSAMAIAGITVGCVLGLKSPGIVEVIDPEINGLVIEKQTAVIGQDFDTKISINTDLVDNCILPETLTEVKSGDDILDASCYTYEVSDDYLNASLHIPGEYIKGDISIKLTLDEMPWYLNKKYINGLTKTDVTKEGGEIQTVKVNGLDHKVRLIGVDEDKNANGETIHTTWEFANSISDANGYSLGVQWNDTNDEGSYNYGTSTINNALNGENVNNVLWAQKDATTWSNDYKCSVLDMLKKDNPGIVGAIKTTNKIVSIYNKELATPGFEDQTINNKLFLLSPKEMGYPYTNFQEKTTFTYSYYKDHTDQTDVIRIKKQINGEVISTSWKPIPVGSGQVYSIDINNFAGYNSKADNTGGDRVWLRSPVTDSNAYAWRLEENGKLDDYIHSVGQCANDIAPAFCI